MDFELSEEQKQIKALIKEFFEREVTLQQLDELSDKATAAKTVEEVRAIYPWDMMKKLQAVGLRQLCVPERFGGGGFDRCGYLIRAIAAEQAGYSMGVAARLLGLPWMHCTHTADDHITEEQKEWFFSQFMADDVPLTATAASEPAGNTDIVLPYDKPPGTTMRVFARKDGDEWVINGDKMFCSGGAVADLIRITARTDKEAHISKGTTNFWVRKDTPGMSYTLNRMLMAEVAGNVQLILDNVRVPESHISGGVNSSHGRHGAAEVKMLVYCDILGHAERIYKQTVEYAKERVGGGRPIIQHTNIAAMLGETALIIEAARAFVYKSAWESDQMEKAGKPVVNKFGSVGSFYHCKKAAWRVCELATEVYGGVTGSLELSVERLARRVFVWLPVGLSPSMNTIQCSMEYNDHTIMEYTVS